MKVLHLKWMQLIMKQMIHWNNEAIKTLATENEYNKLENGQPKIENSDHTENKMKNLWNERKYNQRTYYSN